jgi:hypothetical protein
LKPAFVHVPRTGGTAIIETFSDQIDCRRGYPAMHCKLLDHNWFARRRIAFVRDPWDRIASMFLYVSHLSRKNWCRSGQAAPGTVRTELRNWVGSQVGRATLRERSMWTLLCDWSNDAILVTDLGRFECYAEDCERLFGAVPPHVNLRPVDVGVPLRDVFDDVARDLVSRWADRDAELFGYAW